MSEQTIVTRAEAEANERRYVRTCRGPRDQDLKGRLAEILEAGTAAERPLRAGPVPAEEPDPDPAAWPLSALRETLLGMVGNAWTTDQAISWLLEQGLRRAASQLDAATRRGCGYDVNDQICAHPFDGREHAEDCPKCGVARTWRAPTYPGLKE